MLENSLIPLGFVGGPAILANSCAILQNGVNMRHEHAVEQWRGFQASMADGDGRLSRLYSDPAAVLCLSEKRLRLQLRQLDILVTGASFFGITCVLALVWSVLSQIGSIVAPVAAAGMLLSEGSGLAALVVLATILLQTRCTRTPVGLHLQLYSGARL